MPHVPQAELDAEEVTAGFLLTGPTAVAADADAAADADDAAGAKRKLELGTLSSAEGKRPRQDDPANLDDDDDDFEIIG